MGFVVLNVTSTIGKVMSFCVVLFFLLLPLSSNAGQSLLQSDGRQPELLCPQSDPVSKVQMNGEVLQPFGSSDEERNLLQRLGSRQKNEARNAAVSLAMGGSLGAFRRILQGRDPDLIRSYAWYYQNRNGTRCLDPHIETAVTEHLDEPGTGDALLAFFGKNLYREQRLFSLLADRKPRLRPSPDSGAHIRALVSTNLNAIEERVLEHAVSVTAGVEKNLWWFIPELERYYLHFFVRRQYVPAIAHLQSILDEAHYSSVEDAFRTHTLNRHRYIYYALDTYPSAG